ncbi:luciferin sulfotransferase-like [Clytia hemisphaerica]|uniref:Sulfotransferase domain-containing protein n=1 Tax=Clytia hemisphaerica TaxID=252671 RepID=A0A7M5V466_9CNID
MAATNDDTRENQRPEIYNELITDEEVLKFRRQIDDIEFKGLSFVQPYGYIFSERYIKYHNQFQNFQMFEDDVFIATYPRCGTRWMQELVWRVRNDQEALSTEYLNVRVPMLDFCINFEEDAHNFSPISNCDNLPRPRAFKTHLAYDLLPKQFHQQKKGKAIFVIRNPRDICQSLLNYFQNIENYTGDIQTIANIMTKDGIGLFYGPFFKVVLSYWNKRHDDNILIVFYEEMQKDLGSVIQKVADFLNVSITTDRVEHLVDFLSFNSMKDNKSSLFSSEFMSKSAARMYHKGRVGSWKDVFTPEMIQQFEEWENKHLKNTDLKFIYE